MANLSQTTEMPQFLDQRQVWFTNLLLLGFDPVAQEDKTKVRFCREMFCHINKKGMEVTLHYLFNKLDSHLAYEEFRDCWPVYDKKQEAQFRKVCSNWLTRIAKENPESKLPRLSASLLMSPGGDKFDQLMLRFTAYVLRVVCMREAKGEEKQVFLSSFVTSPDSMTTSTDQRVLQRALQCHVIRHSRSVARRLELATALHDKWRQFAGEQVTQYRSLSKDKRELEAQLEAVSSTSPSSQSEGKSSASTPAADKARKNKMKKVRGFWKALEDFQSKTAHEREVIGAITDGNANRYSINSKDLQFQIPEVILHMYEKELREGKAGNTFEGGKLNLVSLLQLWNCALQVMSDRFRECELPSFQTESEHMSEVLQAHRVNLAAAQNLRASLMDYHQSLQDSIERLEQELQVLRGSIDSQLRAPHTHTEGQGEREEREEREKTSGADNSLPSPPQLHLSVPPITLPSLNLELLPPSPQKSHDMSSPDLQRLKTHLSYISLPSDPVSTPEAVHNISQSVQRVSRSKQSKHPHPHSTSIPRRIHVVSRVTPDPGDSVVESRASQSERVQSSAKSTKREKKSSRSVKSHLRSHVSSHASGAQHSEPVRKATPSSRTGTSHTVEGRSRRVMKSTRTNAGMDGDAHVSGSGSVCEMISAKTPSAQITPTHPRLLDTMPTAHDILAAQIASAVADSSQLCSSPYTPEQIHSLTDPLSALGTGAFVSHDKIPRTPISKPRAESSSPAVMAITQQTTPSHTPTTSTTHSTPAPTVTPLSTPAPTVTPLSTPAPTVTTHSTPAPTVTPLSTPAPTVTPLSTPAPTVTTHSTPAPTVTPHSTTPSTFTTPAPSVTKHHTPLPVFTTPHTVTTYSTPLPIFTTPHTVTAHSSPLPIFTTPHNVIPHSTTHPTFTTPPTVTAHSTPLPTFTTPPTITAHSTTLPAFTSSLTPTPSQHASSTQNDRSVYSPPHLLLDSLSPQPSHPTPPTSSYPISTPQTTVSLLLPISSGVVRNSTGSVSFNQPPSHIKAIEKVNGVTSTSPLISLSPSVPLGVLPTEHLSTPLPVTFDTGGDLLSFNSPTVKGLAAPLVGVRPLTPEQAQSPLVQFSSSPPQQHPPLTSSPTKDLLGSERRWQTRDGNVSTHAPNIDLALHTTGTPLTTTQHQHPATANKASPLMTPRPADTTTGVFTIITSTTPTPHEALTTPAGQSSTPNKTSEQIFTTPASDVLTTPAQASSFLLSSQPPTPFLHVDFDLSASEEEREEEEQRSVPAAHSSCDDGGGGSVQAGGGENSFMIVLKDGDDMALKSPQEMKPNDTSHESQMSSSEPAAAETISHLSSHTCSTHTPLGQMVDVSTPDKQWRPLDLSGDHLTSPPGLPPPLTTTLNHSLKSAEEAHYLSGSGDGLFGEDDSFLVPLSPHSDLSHCSHEDDMV